MFPVLSGTTLMEAVKQLQDYKLRISGARTSYADPRNYGK
jgi:hypothetical protein